MTYKNIEDRKAYQRKYYKKWNAENKDRLKIYNAKNNSRPERKIKIREYEDVMKSNSHRRESKLKGRYKISIEDYDKMLSLQNNKCAICGNVETFIHNKTGEIRRLAVDHNHDTEKIRGLLCTTCNLMIGNSKESIEILNNAIKYLQKYE